jgi:fructoselysine-6-phosphate deglycase
MVKNDNEIYRAILEYGLAQREVVEKVVDEALGKINLKNIFLIGCGGSFAVMHPCKYILETNSNIPVFIYNSSEFNTIQPLNFSKDSLVILSSYSGKTPETVEAANLAKKVGAPTIGFTGFADSPLGHAVDHVFENNAETGVTDSKIILLYQIIFNILKKHENFDKYEEIIKALNTLPDSLVKIKESVEAYAEKWAEENMDTDLFFTLGTGVLWGETYSFAICILEEMQWMKAQPVDAGEFFHGSFEIVREDTPNLLLFKGEDKTRPVAERVEKFINEYSKKYTIIDTKDYPLPGVPEEFRGYVSPLVVSAVLDRFGKHLADKRNHPLKTRKYMGIVDY